MGKRLEKKTPQNVTYRLFIWTMRFAIIWVSISYILAGYATIVLGQPFPAVELSEEAISTLLGVGVLKTTENIFKNNNGFIFGKSISGEKAAENPAPSPEVNVEPSVDSIIFDIDEDDSTPTI